jgi:hypothetical protein
MATTCESIASSLRKLVTQVNGERKKFADADLELNLETNKKRGAPDPDKIKKLTKKREDAIKSGNTCIKNADKSLVAAEKEWYKLNPGARNFVGPYVSAECSQAALLIKQIHDDVRSFELLLNT